MMNPGDIAGECKRRKKRRKESGIRNSLLSLKIEIAFGAANTQQFTEHQKINEHNFTRRGMFDTVATHPAKIAFGWFAIAHISSFNISKMNSSKTVKSIGVESTEKPTNQRKAKIFLWCWDVELSRIVCWLVA